MEAPPLARRTIDDFLDQLYEVYKLRLPHRDRSDEANGEASPSTARSRRRGRWRQYRHCLPLPLLALCVANSSDATEILMLSYLLANSRFRQDMFSEESPSDGDNATSSSLDGAEFLAASIFLGMLLGGMLLGFLSDHIGRRPALLTGLLTNATFGLLSSFPLLTPTIAHLTLWRFVAGIGIGATVPSIFSLASEWSPKEVRGAVVTLVASFWMVGSLFVSSVAWVIFGTGVEHDLSNTLPMWRVFAALCAAPSALGAWMVYRHTPESPRFLSSSKRRDDLAAQACNQMAVSLDIQLTNEANGRASVPNAEADQSNVSNALLDKEGGNNMQVNSMPVLVVEPLREDELRHGSSTTASIPHRTMHTLFRTARQLLSPKLLARTTLPLQAIWFSLSFATYGITTWINTLFVSIHLQDIYFNSFLFALANLPGNVASIFYSDRWGRKRMLVGSLLGAALGLAAFALLVYSTDGDGNGNGEDGPSTRSKAGARTSAIVLSACIFQMFSIISWNALDILTGEMFPTRVRSGGMGLCTASGRFGAMFAQFVNARLIGSEGAVLASSSVLLVAASTLSLGVCMPFFMERDMAMGTLKDEVPTELAHRSISLGCLANGKEKDHMSDDDNLDGDNGLRARPYQSFQREEVHLI